MTIRWIMAVVLGAIMFASVIGVIADQINLAQSGNVTGASSTILGLVPLVLVILFIAKLAGKI